MQHNTLHGCINKNYNTEEIYHPIPDSNENHDLDVDKSLKHYHTIPQPIAHNCSTTAPNQEPPTTDLFHDTSDLFFDSNHYLQFTSWLTVKPPSSFLHIDSSIEHNDGGANCFISSKREHFTTYIPPQQSITQLDGSTALGFGVKLILCPSTNTVTCATILHVHFHQLLWNTTTNMQQLLQTIYIWYI